MSRSNIILTCIGLLASGLMISSYTENEAYKSAEDVKSVSKIELSDDIGDSVMKIFEDRDGNLWFGTKGYGVAKYDGEELVYLTSKDGLCGDDVADIAQDEDGNMWFGTYTDMCKFNGGKFTSFPRNADGVPTLGWGWKSVNSDLNGEIWVNTHHGIFKCTQNASSSEEIHFEKLDVPLDLDVKENSSFCNTPGIVSMDLIDHNGNMWFGTDGLGVYMFDRQEYRQFTKEDGLPSNNITRIIEDKKGHIWFSCIDGLKPDNLGEGGIARYDGIKIETFPNVEGISHKSTYALFADKKDNIWVVAKDLGVYKYDGTEFKLYPLPSDQIIKNDFGTHSILEDKKGRMWFAFSGGLFRLDGSVLTSIDQNGPW